MRGGSLAAGAEVVLEVAAAQVAALHVDGSLLATATAPLGHLQAPPPGAAPRPPPPPPPHRAPTSHDSLEGLFVDDSWAAAEARSEYRTPSPPGAPSLRPLHPRPATMRPGQRPPTPRTMLPWTALPRTRSACVPRCCGAEFHGILCCIHAAVQIQALHFHLIRLQRLS